MALGKALCSAILIVVRRDQYINRKKFYRRIWFCKFYFSFLVGFGVSSFSFLFLQKSLSHWLFSTQHWAGLILTVAPCFFPNINK